ncbi:sensor histidine kinase [Cryptosporangium sp. NPDC051539]|uniref:sensor histidine kinase n=1 Tax=Cryptosporangium sp. NPDC051539 TaxID=3363962 RepID=UPI0037A5A266
MRSLRTRLALVHAGFTFAGGVLLLVLADLPLYVGGHTVPGPGEPARAGTGDNLADVLRYSAVALVVLAAVSLAVGRMLAGRALRPLRALTAAARTMSASDLHHRVRIPAGYREFSELAATFDGLLRRLDDAFTAQRQFVANASHELRTPLTVQRTLLQLTLADPDASAGALRSTCEEVLALGRQQEQLLDALLTLAGGQQGIEHRRPFDLADVTRKAISGRDTGSIRVHTALAPAPVTGDDRLTASLVTNLLDNAVRHNVPGGSVEIAVSPGGCLTVSNTGAPVPAEEIDRLFQPFQRLGTDRTDQTAGHGLGLAIVAAIARAQQARLLAQPRPDGGLRISVCFPAQGSPTSSVTSDSGEPTQVST